MWRTIFAKLVLQCKSVVGVGHGGEWVLGHSKTNSHIWARTTGRFILVVYHNILSIYVMKYQILYHVAIEKLTDHKSSCMDRSPENMGWNFTIANLFVKRLVCVSFYNKILKIAIWTFIFCKNIYRICSDFSCTLAIPKYFTVTETW